MIQITCKGNSAICTRKERLTSGMVGLQCEFVFDDAWDGLAKMAVFTAGNEKRDVLLKGAICEVPPEVMRKPGYQLVIGVYGTNADGTLVIPTCYAMCGGIDSGADPSGDESTDPTLPVWGQMQGMIGDLADLATVSKDNLVDAINEAAQSGGGGGSAVELDATLSEAGKAADAKAVGDALAEKQNTLIESGATVGQIAKITAVDDSGKPTAWQAVDMPSGGGGTDEEYELIFTDTVTEDTAGYSRDTDANGNTFALKKAILIVFTPPYEKSDTSYGRGVGFLPTARWGHDCISTLRDSIKSSAGGTGQYDVIFAEIIMGHQVCTAKFESQNTTNVFSSMQPVTKAGLTGLQFVSDATKLMQISNPTGNMTCVKIVGYASPIIAKNTQIALYGVRA